MLAEPNLLAINGKQASFVAGGEFPFPMVQGGVGDRRGDASCWREYGIRLNFLPDVTPRGTIRLQVAPEVSALDYTNAVTIEGVTVPGLTTRRVQTEVELESGQTFVIAGLLDNQITETLSKIPGIGRHSPAGQALPEQDHDQEQLRAAGDRDAGTGAADSRRRQPVPELKYPVPFMTNNSDIADDASRVWSRPGRCR